LITDSRKQKIKFSVIISIIAIIIFVALFIVVRYQVEGEKNMPFNLGKIIVISSASTSPDTDVQDNNVDTEVGGEAENAENVETEANVQEEESYLWKEKVIQTNDVYIYLDKNEDFKEDEVIKNVRIENIQILKNVNLGKIQVYMPNSLDEELYKYTNDFLVNSTLTYKGASVDNKKTLEIGNQGGCICLSFANVGVGVYKSNEDEVIEQGAFILEKMNVADEDLKFKVSFDLIIEVSDKSYKGTVTLDLPAGDVVGKKESHVEITDFENVIFKRF